MAKRNRSKAVRRARRRSSKQAQAEVRARSDRSAADRAARARVYAERRAREEADFYTLDPYESVMIRVGPRICQISPILCLSDVLQNGAAKLNYSDPWLHALYEQKRQTWRDHAELDGQDRFLRALERKNLQWVPMDVPADVEISQHKRSVLANTEYICYLAEDSHWYIGREVCEMGLDDEDRPEPYFDEKMHRIGLQTEVWSGPYANEAVAQKSMMFHLSEGHNLEIDPESALSPDMADWREEAGKRLRNFAPFRHVPEADEDRDVRRVRTERDNDLTTPEISRSAAASIGKRKRLPRELGFMPEDTRLAQNREHVRS